MDPAPEILELAREEAAECLARLEGNLLALEQGSPSEDMIDDMFRDAHSIKGTASMVGLNDVAAIGHAMEDCLDRCRQSGELPLELVEPLLGATDSLKHAVAGDQVSVGHVIEQLGLAPAPSDPQPAGPSNGAATGAEAPAAQGRGIRVGAGKVDRMLDAVGETVLHHRRLEHQLGGRILAAGDDVAEGELDMGERLLSELQQSVLEMRTLPLESITGPYARAVRDLAVAQGLEVELVIAGGETQLDRTILDGISDPLSHLVRNAVAHGIELPEEREQAGKARRGRVELRGEQRGSMVAVTVADDGRGVSPELLARAGQAGSLTDLLSAPGFSTAAEVSEIAGRGVGLDAVRKQVERLGGSVDVTSEPGQGTSVTLVLPLTLALLRVLICERGGRAFGVPLASVREVVGVGETASLGGHQSVVLRGEALPLGDLAASLGAEAGALPEGHPAIVLAGPARAVALACDRVLGDEEVVMKGLGPLLASVPGYLGAAILGDGRVVLILDPGHLLSSAAQKPTNGRRHLSPQPEQREAPNVLVVDDQFTVRELQRSILETAGYRVETARDGHEALARLGRDGDIDLVLTDVQMPKMDGFELLEAVRAQPEHAALPVVVVTSQAGEDDKRRGVEAGADAYIVKQEFDQQALLETLERLVGR